MWDLQKRVKAPAPAENASAKPAREPLVPLFFGVSGSFVAQRMENYPCSSNDGLQLPRLQTRIAPSFDFLEGKRRQCSFQGLWTPILCVL